MKKSTKNEIKRYVVSSVVTFLTGFLTVVSIQLADLNVETLTQGAILGILLAGVRAGVKALVEYLPELTN